MKLRHMMWIALPILCSCGSKVSETPIEPVPEGLVALAWLNTANPDVDVKQAISRKDYRLKAVAGRGPMVPGVPPDIKQHAIEKCGVDYMPGMGDVMRSKEHRKWWKKGLNYAITYNEQLLPFCTK